MRGFHKLAKKIAIMTLATALILINARIKVEAATITDDKSVKVEYVTQTTDLIPSKSGDKVIVTVRVSNNDRDMNNIKVTPGITNTAFFVSGGYSAGVVKKGEAIEVQLSGTYKGSGDSISCNIEYEYNGDKYITNGASVPVVTSAAAPSGAPNLIVSSVIDTLKSGANGVYSVKFPLKNNGSALAKNVVITPDFSNSPFKGAADIYRIDKIGANGIADVTIEFSNKAAATKGTYAIPFNYTYSDDAGQSFSGSYTIYAESNQGKTSPSLIVTNLKVSDDSIMAGDNFDITYDLKNTGELPAYDVKVKVDGLGKDTFIPSAVTTTSIFKQINGLEVKNLKYNLTASPTIIGDIYEVNLQISYKDGDGVQYNETSTIYLTAGAATSSIAPKLVVQSALQDKSAITPGSDFNVVIKLSNRGAQAAKNVKVTLSGFSTTTFIPTEKLDYKFAKDIAGNTIVDVIFPVTASESIATGMHELGLSVEYTDGAGNVYTEQSKVYITDVEGTGAGSPQGTPKVIITSFQVEGEGAKAGQQMTFNFAFQNTSSLKALNNMKITLSSQSEKGTIFSVAEGSNTFYIKHMATEEVIQKSMIFDVKTDIVSGSYPLNIQFEYEDEAGNPYNATEIIYIPVDELAKPVINRVEIPPYAELYMTQPIVFEFFNMGKSTLSNVQARVEGLTSTKELTYIGNIEPGKGDIYEVEVMFDMPGEINATLVVSHENSRGELVETRYDFMVFVQEPYIPDVPPIDPNFPMDPIEEVKKPILPVPAIIGIEVGLFVVSMLVTRGVIITRKKKQLRERDIQEV